MQSLRVRLLGELQVEGCDLATLGRRQQRTLLKILALHHGRPVSVGHLTECLWGDAAPARASEQISVLASRLRAVLGAERIERTDAGYKLTLDWLDLDALGDYVAEAERRLAQDALVAARTAAAAGVALVRGRLLADEPDPWWAAPESAVAEQWLRRLRHALLLASSLSGDFMEAEHQARRAAGPDPFDEVAVRALMTALARTGRSASALSAYAQFRTLLAEELGVSPEEDTEELHGAILRGTLVAEDPHPLHGDRGQGGGSRPDLPGRAAALGQLDALFEDSSRGRCILCVVEGEAGIGKTRLLRTWAEGFVGLAVGVASVTCDELGQALALQPVLDLVAALAQAPGGEGADCRPRAGHARAGASPRHQSRWDTAVAVGRPDRARHGSGHPPRRGRRVPSAARRENQPVVLLLDDAHLADPATVRWLSQAPTQVGDASVFIVVSTRLEEDLRLPGATLTVALDPLDLEAATAIVGLERAGDLLARSGGNALFLTELAAWETTEADSNAHLPDTSEAPSRSAVPGPARREPRCTRPL